MEEKLIWRQKMAGQATVLDNWAQKVGGRLPVLPNRLRRQWTEVTYARVMSVFNSWIVTYEVNKNKFAKPAFRGSVSDMTLLHYICAISAHW